MTMSTKARVALFLALAAVLVAGIAGANSAGASTETTGGAGSDGVAGICVEISPASPESDGSGPPASPHCDDTIGLPVEPDQPVDCGEQVDGTGPDASVSFTPCPGDEEPQPADPYDGAEPVEPRPGMDGVAPIPFDKVVVGPDDRTLTVFFWSGVEPCYVLDRADVDENPGAITITLFQGHDPSAVSAVCIDIAVLKKVEVRVDAPVADRRIVDGAA
jgi:hypothetical protein